MYVIANILSLGAATPEEQCPKRKGGTKDFTCG
jgi:hypothetical protein